jgi:hypothetical protein
MSASRRATIALAVACLVAVAGGGLAYVLHAAAASDLVDAQATKSRLFGQLDAVRRAAAHAADTSKSLHLELESAKRQAHVYAHRAAAERRAGKALWRKFCARSQPTAVASHRVC